MSDPIKKLNTVRDKSITAILVVWFALFSTIVFAGTQQPQIWDGCYSIKDGVLKVSWETNFGDKATSADLYNKETGKIIASLSSSQIANKGKPGEGCKGEFTVNNIQGDSITVYVVLDNNPSIKSKDVTAKAAGSGDDKQGDITYNCGYDANTIPPVTREFTIWGTNGQKVECNLKITKEPSKGALHVDGAKFIYEPTDPELKSAFTDNFSYKLEQNNTDKVLKEGIITLNFKYFEPLRDLKYYEEHINDFKPNNWLDFWAKSNLPGTKGDFTSKLATLKYYIRVSNVDLSKIEEQESPNNPDNVNRIIRIMPKAKFEKVFPYTADTKTERNGFIPGITFSYLNFLKAAAVLPGYCGDYDDFPLNDSTHLMCHDPEIIAKRFLATTMAHAVQETSDQGPKENEFDLDLKIKGTFGHLKEANAQSLKYHDASGPFGPQGYLYYLTENNCYYGRGAKQLSYPSNYANVSLLLYGDLRLVKYPQLVEESVLPFLTSIAYMLIPKSGNPSLAEVMDGSWSEALHNAAPADFKKIYDRDFPLTVLLVNGGPECNGKTDIPSVNRSRYRIDAYNKFSTDGALLDPTVDYKVENEPANEYYKVDKLKTETINFGPNKWNTLFARPYYYNGKKDGVVSWDTNIQIFGGKSVMDNIIF